MANVLIVLGMHRSGTSLISGWLKNCGLNLGERLGGRGIANKLGHFEDLDFLSLHQEILEHHNIADRGLVPPFDFELTDYHYQKIKNIVESRDAINDQWGWKEPRTCLFLNYYKELIPTAKYLMIHRNYSFVVESLIRRDINGIIRKYQKLDIKDKIEQAEYYEAEINKIIALKDTYLLTWIIYNQKILDLIGSIPDENYLLLKYTDLLKDDINTFKCLTSWAFRLTYSPFSLIFNNALINEDRPDIIFDEELEREAILVDEKMCAMSRFL